MLTRNMKVLIAEVTFVECSEYVETVKRLPSLPDGYTECQLRVILTFLSKSLTDYKRPFILLSTIQISSISTSDLDEMTALLPITNHSILHFQIFAVSELKVA